MPQSHPHGDPSHDHDHEHDHDHGHAHDHAHGESPGVRLIANTSESAVRHRVEVEVEARQVDRALDRAYRDLARRCGCGASGPERRRARCSRSSTGSAIAEDLERELVGETLSARSS